jgi:hypothetical protein
MKQSNSFGNLTESSRNLEHGFNIDSTTMKRNKSFWRFSKSEDILEGMALWKHRDLVPIDIESVDKEMTLKKPEKQSKKTNTLQKKNSQMDTMKSSGKEKRDVSLRVQNPANINYGKERKDDFTTTMDFDDEIYDESPKRRNDKGPSGMHSQTMKSEKSKKSNVERFQDTNFYDDDVMVVKTVKRKEILKQYYSSGTDTELSSSDPYDCIIVDDHLGPSTSTFRKRNSYAAETDKRGSMYSRSNKHEVTGTLLPRTKLKAGRNDTSEPFDSNERMNTTKSNKSSNKNNFGPWSNMWPDE